MLDCLCADKELEDYRRTNALQIKWYFREGFVASKRGGVGHGGAVECADLPLSTRFMAILWQPGRHSRVIRHQLLLVGSRIPDKGFTARARFQAKTAVQQFIP